METKFELGVSLLIDALNATRKDVAMQNHYLSCNDAARGALKVEIVAELMAKGQAATPADKAASQDTRMVENATVQRDATLKRDNASADAESLRFRVKLALIELAAECDKD